MTPTLAVLCLGVALCACADGEPFREIGGQTAERLAHTDRYDVVSSLEAHTSAVQFPLIEVDAERLRRVAMEARCRRASLEPLPSDAVILVCSGAPWSDGWTFALSAQPPTIWEMGEAGTWRAFRLLTHREDVESLVTSIRRRGAR